jgi:peptidoglycan hydrolase-like protein with peptidoglycan-binding domain
MTKKIIRLTEKDLTNIVKRVISEQDVDSNYNRAIQCFLNKKGIKDNTGQPLKLDGSIGNLPNSKSAQAIAKYQAKIGVSTDGVWGSETKTKMPQSDMVIYKQCVSDYGDIIDKGKHWLGLDK